MNLKHLILIAFFLFGNTVLSQKKELHIEYDFYFKDYYPENQQISVITNNEESLSTITRTIMLKDYGATSFEPKSFYNHFFRTKDSIFFKEDLNRKKHFIAESLSQFKWELTGNSETVLGYNCQEAKTSYRGRDYIAYFTTGITFKVAPWKFHGLPGVMLLVKTNDNKIKIQATKLEIKPISGDIVNPYSEINEFMTWDEFKIIKAKSWEDYKHKAGSQITLTKNNGMFNGKPRVRAELRMEIVVEANRW